MIPLIDLWLPILLSAVIVFVASSIFHMMLPIHKNDYRTLPDEDKALAALREAGATPGHYMFPACNDMKLMKSPEMLEKYTRGPVGFMTILPNGPFNMGKGLGLWFVFCLIVGIFTAYIGSLALPAGSGYDMVFRVTGAVAILGYAFTHFVDSVWKGLSWSITVKFMAEGVVYALLTAGVFGWLWPGS